MKAVHLSLFENQDCQWQELSKQHHHHPLKNKKFGKEREKRQNPEVGKPKP